MISIDVKNNNADESKPSEIDDRRVEPDRRRFSYTHHIPERRSGVDRRSEEHRLAAGRPEN
jgi:hypothetical protein